MISMIHELYKSVYPKFDQNWLEGYKTIVEKTGKISEQTDFSSNENQVLLKQLLKEHSNGIASAGQSYLTDGAFEKLINNSTGFLDALVEFKQKLGDLDADTFSDLKEKFEKAFDGVQVGQGKNHPIPSLRLYRVVAACTTKVTPVVNEPDFNRAYQWLIDHVLEEQTEGGDWFTKNLWLVEKLRSLFKIGNEYIDLGNKVPVDDYRLNVFVWYLATMLKCPRAAKQVIKYGPPGTGKTYTSMRDAEQAFALWKVMYTAPEDSEDFKFEDHVLQLQFHPSYGYEDFIEGLRPRQIAKGEPPQLCLTNGKFKDFCKKAAQWELDLVKAGIDNIGSRKTALDTKLYEFVSNQMNNQNGGYSLGQQEVDSKHWGYIYEYAQTMKDDNNDSESVKLRDSVVLRDVLPPYFVLIDEINRAELSRVFGEMMYSFEYRGVAGAVSTQYATLNTEEDAVLWKKGGDPTDKERFEALFFVPNNVIVIGTMNTIDRSVESFDFALRRRFRWEYVGPDEDVLGSKIAEFSPKLNADNRQKLIEGWRNLNEKIRNAQELGDDYQIGHAYLLSRSFSSRSLNEIRETLWNDSIKPLLEEYLRSSYGKDDREAELKNYRDAFFCLKEKDPKKNKNDASGARDANEGAD